MTSIFNQIVQRTGDNIVKFIKELGNNSWLQKSCKKIFSNFTTNGSKATLEIFSETEQSESPTLAIVEPSTLPIPIDLNLDFLPSYEEVTNYGVPPPAYEDVASYGFFSPPSYDEATSLIQGGYDKNIIALKSFIPELATLPRVLPSAPPMVLPSAPLLEELMQHYNMITVKAAFQEMFSQLHFAQSVCETASQSLYEITSQLSLLKSGVNTKINTVINGITNFYNQLPLISSNEQMSEHPYYFDDKVGMQNVGMIGCDLVAAEC